MSSLIALSPALTVCLGGVLLSLVEVLGSRGGSSTGQKQRGISTSDYALLAFVVLLAGAIGSAALWARSVDGPPISLGDWLRVDGYALWFWVLSCGLGALTALLMGHAPDGAKNELRFPLLLLTVVTAMLLSAAVNLVPIALCLTLLALSSALLGALGSSPKPNVEAAAKHFLAAVFASLSFLLGAALLYGATGATGLGEIGSALDALRGDALSGRAGLVLSGAALVCVGLLFHLRAAPLHFTSVDRSSGSSAPTAALFDTVVALAVAAMGLRVFGAAFGTTTWMSWGSGWPPLVAGFAACSLLYGSLVASRQTSVSRMLAYSAVTHVGVLLCALVASTESAGAVPFTLTYLAGTALSVLGAYGVLALIPSEAGAGVSLEDISGLGRTNPRLALAALLFFGSLLGAPLTIGFVIKVGLFWELVLGEHNELFILVVVASLLQAFSSIRVLVHIYGREPKLGKRVPTVQGLPVFALLVTAALVIGLGLCPEALLSAARASLP